MGAKPNGDGLSTTAFPSGVGSIPIEIVENEAPVLYEMKEFMKNSGGIGKYRGGLGQKIVIKCIENKEMKKREYMTKSVGDKTLISYKC